jgi:hypothetical protein
LRRVDCIDAELVNGATALDVDWPDVARECYAIAKKSAAKLGIHV